MTKEFILAEIKRTAVANGGVPLGHKRFAHETGIAYRVWFGKFWARWGDALQEAGFERNQLQGAYDKTELLQKYAIVARQLGRIPAAGDLRLRAHNDPDFPENTTFENHFGRKPELVRELRDFCAKHEEFGDVLALCDGYRSTAPRPVAWEGLTELVIGFVYLTRAGRFYKIGKTNAAGRREREIALQLPEKSSTVHVIRTDDPAGIEAYWHNRFSSKRRNGEWFELSADDVAAFKRRKFM